MESCKHQKLILAKGNQTRLRCVHCHLTISPEEIGNGCCPECYAEKGEKRYDFEEMVINETTRYRCEECGAVIECD